MPKTRKIRLLIGVNLGRRFIALRTVKEVRAFTENYAPVKDFLVGDISMMSREVQSIFLKFLEEKAERTFEVYASIDNLDSTLLSRFDEIVKEPRSVVGKNEFQDYLIAIGDDGDSAEVLLETAPTSIRKFYMWRTLPYGIRTRIKDLI